MTVYGRRQQTLNDYEGFIDKFKPRKTTDDCLTPEPVYEAVRDWAVAEYGLQGRDIVRPFWPGGDYEMFDYPDGCVVIDNPPFSILSRIVRFFRENGVDYFIFAPHLSAFSGAATNHVQCGCDVVYANGATVRTSFTTSLGSCRIDNAPGLYDAVMSAQAAVKGNSKSPLPVYDWPEVLLRTTELDSLTKAGIRFRIADDECVRVGNIDAMRDMGKGVFGGAYLISRASAKAKAEAKAEAEAEAEAKALAEIIKIELSPAECETVARLGQGRPS
jgi:hypothetical protein